MAGNLLATIVALVLGHQEPGSIQELIYREDVVCMAENVYHEARGEPVQGQVAVANVTLNRVKAGKWADTVCDVVFQSQQFEWTISYKARDSPKDRVAWSVALSISAMVYTGIIEDQTRGATYFYAPKKVHPKWAKQMTRITRIGDHLFLKEDPAKKATKQSTAKHKSKAPAKP